MGQWILVECSHLELSKKWLITFARHRYESVPSEYRSILLMGDFAMAITSVFAALYTWRQYNFYVRVQELTSEGVAPGRAQQLLSYYTQYRTGILVLSFANRLDVIADRAI